MNQSLFQGSEIESRIRAASGVLLFLDFDGTLAPLEVDPAAARIGAATRQTLSQLAANERIVMTIISGRAISDLLPRITLPGLIYAGNHGLEICGRQLSFIEPVAAARREDLRELTGRLAVDLEGFAGVLVENKGLTATVHYRNAAGRDVAGIEDTVRALTSPVAAKFAVRSGKKVFEIVPRTNWHKGAAALWIKRRLNPGNALPIYLGDDATDEDAFRALPDGITVKVGEAGDPAATSARYRVPDPPSVHEFLTWLTTHVPA